jgi:hypothetical protein
MSTTEQRLTLLGLLGRARDSGLSSTAEASSKSGRISKLDLAVDRRIEAEPFIGHGHRGGKSLVVAAQLPAGDGRANDPFDFALRGETDLFDELLDRRRYGLVTHGAPLDPAKLVDTGRERVCQTKTRN